MATTNTATKTRQKTQHRRASGTKTARSSPHDYAKLIGVKVKNSVELVKQVENGLAFTAVEALQRQMDLAAKEMARLLDIKFRTFLRRKEAGRLQPAESDRPVGIHPASHNLPVAVAQFKMPKGFIHGTCVSAHTISLDNRAGLSMTEQSDRHVPMRSDRRAANRLVQSTIVCTLAQVRIYKHPFDPAKSDTVPLVVPL